MKKRVYTEAQREYNREWRKGNKARCKELKAEWAQKNPEKHQQMMTLAGLRWRAQNPEKRLWHVARIRAKKFGREFSIEVSDVVIPAVCPVFGFPFTKEGEDRNRRPSLDRVDNSKGYIKGNVIVVSVRANKLKNDATIEELKKLVAFYGA